MKRLILGLSGYSLSGKNYLADLLVKHKELLGLSNCEIPVLSFAQPLKRMLLDLLGDENCGMDWLEKNKDKVFQWEVAGEKHYITVRQLLINLSQDGIKRIVPEFWTNLLIQKIDKFSSSPLIIITDMRYLQEIGLLRERFPQEFKFVWVNREDAPVNTNCGCELGCVVPERVSGWTYCNAKNNPFFMELCTKIQKHIGIRRAYKEDRNGM